MTDPKDRAQSVFLDALEMTSETERAAFIEAKCAGDDGLRCEVEELLDHAQRLGRFMEGGDEDSATLDQPITEKPGTVIGPYKLLQKIGEGGFGVVYMADQTEPVKRRVALKIIKPGMDTRQVIARFEAERQALAMMDHPNIAKVLDAGTTDSDRPYFVMELVKGVPITQFCDEKQLTPRERLELFVPVCQAIQHAHQKGIIHRDIKPSNVLVAEYDDRPIPKVIDFGVAKATEQQLTEKTVFTQLGQVVGTVDYMSPEQAKFNQLDIDTRSDVYSLGVLLYELLTGETPFDRERLRSAAFDELLRIIREEEPPRPSLRLSTSESLPSTAANRHTEPRKLTTLVHGELDWIVMKALEKDRTRRYETANGFANDIQRYLDDEAVVACPPSAAYRFRKFARRNKSVLTTAIGVALILVLGIVGTTWQMFRAIQAEREIQIARDVAQEERDRALEAERLAGSRLKEAEAARVMTRKALDEMSSEVVGDWLSSKEELTGDQLRIMEQSLTLYEQFAAETANDLVTKVSAASAAVRVGQLRRRLGQVQVAVEALTRGITLYEDIVRQKPDALEHRLGLIGCLQERAASLFTMHGPDASQADESRSQRLLEQLVRDYPQNTLARKMLITDYSHRASRAQRMSHPADALMLNDKALAEQQSMTAQAGKPPAACYEIAVLHGNRSGYLKSLGRAEEAEREQEKAISILDELVTDHPDNTDYKCAAATCHLNRAMRRGGQERFQEAEVEYLIATRLQLELAAAFPSRPEYHMRLGQTAINHSRLLFATERIAEAKEIAEQSVKIWERLVLLYPDNPGYVTGLAASRTLVARALEMSGSHEEALSVITDSIARLLETREKVGLTVFVREDLQKNYAYRARWLSKLGRYDEALADWSSAFELGRDDEPRH